MALPARTAPQLATIEAMSLRLTEFWSASDAILQFDGAFPGNVATARSALDAARTALIDAINNPLFGPGANKTSLLERIAICTELAVASLEGVDLQVVPNLEASSREVARVAVAECGRLTV